MKISSFTIKAIFAGLLSIPSYAGADSTSVAAPTVYVHIQDAIQAARESLGTPTSEIEDKRHVEFPVYGHSVHHFFRGAVINTAADLAITQEGWKSGYDRGVVDNGPTLGPDAPFDDRVIQYVGVKSPNGASEPFPRNASVVGVLTDPMRTIEVSWGTGVKRDPNLYLRLDEIELGPGSKDKNCEDIEIVDTHQLFIDRGLESKFSTTGEWEVNRLVPSNCIVTTYRVSSF